MSIKLEFSDVEIDKWQWYIWKIAYLPKSITDVDIEISGRVVTLINLWKGKFIPWFNSKI